MTFYLDWLVVGYHVLDFLAVDKRKGIFNGDGAGNFGWQQPITREAVACIIYRTLEAAGALGNLSDV